MINRTQDEIIKSWQSNITEPIASVRCITYNHEKYIAQALDSFLMQETNFPFEIVVHDDASTDKTADIIREYEAKYPIIIKPIYETENLYSKKDGSLRKIMDNACKGKYIAYCEGDDYWCDPHKLQMQHDAMEAHPECSLCTHIVQEVTENGDPIKLRPDSGVFSKKIISQNEFGEILFTRNQHPLQTSSFFVKRKDLINNNLFFAGPGCGDEKILRMSLKEGNVFFIESVMSCYRRMSAGSWSSRNSGDASRHLKILSNTLQLNHSFDIYTHNQFNQFIEIGNTIIQLNIFIINRDYKSLFSPQYKDFSRKYIAPYRLHFYFILSKMPVVVVNAFFQILFVLKQNQIVQQLHRWILRIKTNKY